MGRMRVKDMPRAQQKAVFARMTDNGYLARLESAEMYHRRRDFLRKKHDLAEETEDRIMDVWNDKKLTYRQKMAKIGKIKNEASRKLVKHEKAEIEPTIVGEMREEKWKRFQKQAHPISITEVPEGHDRQVFDAQMATKKMPSESLYSHEGMLFTQKEYVEGLKNKGRKLPKGSIATIAPAGAIDKRTFDSYVFHGKPKKNVYIKVNGLLLSQSAYRKALRRNAKVRYPHQYSEEKKKGNLHKFKKTSMEAHTEEIERRVIMNKSDKNPDGRKLEAHIAKKGLAKTKAERREQLREAGLDPDNVHFGYGAYVAKRVSFERGSQARAEREVIARGLEKKKNAVKSPHAVATTMVKAGVKAKDKKAVARELKEQKGMAVGNPHDIQNGNYLKFAGEKGEQMRFGEISIEQYKKDMAAYRKKSSLTYGQLKKGGSRIKPHTDTDGDGVKNVKDCRPLDKTKHRRGVGLKKGSMLEKAVTGYMRSRTAEGRAKAARARIREVETKQHAEKLEAKARAMEQEYKKEHPSFVTRVRKTIAERRKKKSIYA